MIPIRKPDPKKIKDVPRERRVLLICGDTQVGLWVLRAMGMNGLTVFGVCNTPQGQGTHSRYCAGSWMIEKGPGAAPSHVQIEALARELDVASVMPIAEAYHKALILNRERFEPDIHLFIPPADAFFKAVDKDHMQALCKELDIPVARGTRLDRYMSNGRASLKFPLILRTARQNDDQAKGRAPWKAAYAENEKQLERLYQRVEHYADNVLVNEYHPGAEEHVQILMHNGECFATGDYIGEHHFPLGGGVTAQRVTCHHQPVIDDAVRMLKALKWDGIAGVQFHYDPKTDKYVFCELNPRFSGGLPSVVMAGFHASFLLWQSHFEPEQMVQPKYKVGLRSRILGGDANWMFGLLRGDQLPPGEQRPSKIGTVARFVWNFGPWTRDDSFLFRDMKPFFVDFRQMVRKLGSQTWDIIGNPQSQETR